MAKILQEDSFSSTNFQLFLNVKSKDKGLQSAGEIRRKNIVSQQRNELEKNS